MNNAVRLLCMCFFVLLAAGTLVLAQDGQDKLHDDYYFGFSQGAYYGLMLAGETYDVAWCMRSELEFGAKSLGAGGEFQQKLDAMLDDCRERFAKAQ